MAQETCRELLIDFREDFSQGVALDIYRAARFFELEPGESAATAHGRHAGRQGVADHSGITRKPVGSRPEVLETNVRAIGPADVPDAAHQTGFSTREIRRPSRWMCLACSVAAAWSAVDLGLNHGEMRMFRGSGASGRADIAPMKPPELPEF